jgi:hypothetical protein
VDSCLGVACCAGADSWLGEDSWLGADSCLGADSRAEGDSPEADSCGGVDSDECLDSGDRGACAGGWSVEPLEWTAWCLEAPVALPLAPVLLLMVLPGNACAATSASAPVSTTLLATSQRLMRESLRNAASLL